MESAMGFLFIKIHKANTESTITRYFVIRIVIRVQFAKIGILNFFYGYHSFCYYTRR